MLPFNARGVLDGPKFWGPEAFYIQVLKPLNLPEFDWERLRDQRAWPIYVSDMAHDRHES
jgi:hypothetical protein